MGLIRGCVPRVLGSVRGARLQRARPPRGLLVALAVVAMLVVAGGSSAMWRGGAHAPRRSLAIHIPTTTYTSNAEWTLANSPYVLDGAVTVAAGATLTIDPGVIVKFNGQFQTMTINGTLSAVGTAANPIIFTSYQDDTAGGDTNGDGTATTGAPGQWYQIGFNSSGSQMTYVNVRYGGYGSAYSYAPIYVYGSGYSVALDHATITYNQQSAVVVGSRSSVSITNSTLSNNAYGLFVDTATVTVDRTTIDNNSARGVYFNLPTFTPLPAVSTITNSEISGNGGYGVYIGANGDYPLASMPTGSSDNIYANNSSGTQLTVIGYPGFTNADVNWRGNYWGDSVYFWYSAALCGGSSPYTQGHLAYRASGGNVPAGPIDGGSYFVQQGNNVYWCGYDTFKLGPADFSPTRFDTSPRESLWQTLGEVNGKNTTQLLADPVDSATGNFKQAETDAALPGPGVPFVFARAYNSLDLSKGELGQGWTDSLAASLTIRSNGDVTVRGEDGQQQNYTKQPDGSFLGAAGALSTLVSVSGAYDLTRADQVKYHFDSQGRLTSEVDRNGQGLTLAYGGDGTLATATDAEGRAVTFTHTSGLLTKITLPDTSSVNYGYTNGALTSVTDLNGKVWTYSYDVHGFLASETDPLGHIPFQNTFGSDGRVSQQLDALNHTTSFSWDPATQTETVTDPDTHVWKDVYQNNVLLKRIDPAGDTVQFGHDIGLDTTAVTSPNGSDTTSMIYQNGNLMTATAPASLGGAQKTFTYDTQNNVKTVTDARGKLTQYGYDTAGNNNSIILDGQQVFGATYNAQGQMLTSTDGNQKQTSYTYDSVGNLASVTDPLGNKTSYTYDTAGRVLTKVDPLGNCNGCTPADYTTSYTHDTVGHLLTEVDPLGHTTTHVYDDAGRESSVTDANSHATTYTYDNANRLIQTTGPDPDGAGPLEAPVTTYSYDTAGNRLTMIGPRGNCSGCNPATFTTSYTYDQNNRLASVTTPKGEKTTYSYDSNGNLATVVDPRGNVQGANPADYTTTNSYDAAGRLLTSTDPLSHVTTNHYDPVGNLDWTKDANLHQTSYSYDAASRILTVTAPDTGLTTYTYDGNGSVKTRKDDNNHTTTYFYDDAGHLSQITGPGATPPVTTYTYDLNGNVASTTDPNGNATQTAGDGTTTYTHDHADRLTGISYSDTTPAVTFGYDNAGNRTSMSDGSGNVTYSLDNLDRLTSLTRGSSTFSYNYDVASNITSRTYPDTTQTSYTYDEDNRLTSATSGGNTTNYTYYPNSQLWQTTLPSANGYVDTRSYDHAARLTELKNAKGASVLSDFVSTLDPVGNPTQIAQTGAVSATQTYTYDANDRITQVCFQTGSCPNPSDPKIGWSYDKVGNRLTEARNTGTTTSSYNALDELTQTVGPPPGPSAYSGQVQTDGAQPYWRLGEPSGSTTFASSVGSYTGTWTGSPSLGVSGALNGDANTAVTLNGSSQYGSVTSASGLNKTNNFSLELWIKRSTGATTQAVAGKPLTTITKSENYAIWIDTSNDARFEVGAGTKSATVTCTAHPLDTNWRHIVGTFASGTLKIYYDGSLCNTATANFTTATTNNSAFNIGLSGTNNYNGSLDEIAFYGTALTATQIADHHTKGTATATVTYGYDTNGNQTAAGSRSLGYDLANRLLTTTLASTTTTYSYDGDSNRLQASTGALASQKTNYLWDTNQPLTQLALERDGNNTLIRRYIYGAGRISMSSGSNTYYYHYNQLGSVVNLTNATGTTEWTDSYEPYGAIHTETQNDPNAPMNLMKFAGEYNDPTGLYYLRARQYDPTSGRFSRPDPVAPDSGASFTAAYAYGSDQPTTMSDPSGEIAQPNQPSDSGTRTMAAVVSPASVDATKPPWANTNCQSVAKVRERLVTYAKWAVVNGSPRAYSNGGRPIRDYPKINGWPYSTDCSGGVSLLYMWATCGNPKYDPNGTDWGNASSSLEMLHGVAISVKNLQPGDLVVYGSEHVAMAVTAYRGMSNTRLVSFGYAPGHYVTLASENAAHSSVTPSYRRYLPNR